MDNQVINDVQQQQMDIRGHKFIFGSKTYIMGFLNMTPDSFSDGGKYDSEEKALLYVLDMIKEGADIIDIGGESSRPGHTRITEEEEMKRIIPIIKRIRANTDIPISLDTIKPKVAEAALEAGVDMINDIWGLQLDNRMAKVAAEYGAPVIIMHNQNGTVYNEDMIDSIKRFYRASIEIALREGIENDKIILDPGIGFGKTPEQNILMMSRIREIKEMGYPVLLGTSRKSFLGQILDLPPNERVDGSVATTVLGIVQGVDMVRVHDIKENARAAKVTDAVIRRL